MGSNFYKLFCALNKVSDTKRNVNLKDITSFKIGGKAKILTKPSSVEQICKVMDILKSSQVKYMVIGNATNLLMDDYNGVIVQLGNNYSNVEVEGNVIIADAGASVNKIALIAKDCSLSGMEHLYGIPGTIGGAVTMNAGAFGKDVSAVVTSVLAIVNGKIKHFNHEECGFAYRNSAFSNAVILRVELTLTEGSKDVIGDQMNSYLSHRKNTQPLNFASAGCVFKNFSDLSIGKVLDQDGFKGLTVGGAMISIKHANFIVNTGNATSQDVKELIKVVSSHIKSKYNREVETEIKIIE